MLHHGPSDEVRPDTSDPDIATNKHTLQRVREKVKTAAKRALNIDSPEHGDVDKTPYAAAVEELNDSPAFNTSKLLNKSRIESSGVPEKVIAFLQGTVNAVIDPKEAIKFRATRKTAGKIAKSHPYLSRQADMDFLQAHDDLAQAQDTQSSNVGEAGSAQRNEDVDDCEEHVQALENKRHNMRVAWITSRHVQRARVVDPLPPPFPDDSFFEEKDDSGFSAFNWGKWIIYKLLIGSHHFTAQYIDDFEELPFDIDTMRRYAERFIVVSAPLQTFVLDVRRIYTWEDPMRTGKWMALYFFCWYISHIMTFIYGYIICCLVMNYYCPMSPAVLRAEIERSIDRGATALKAGEMMDQHGSKDWLAPLIDQLGPIFQVYAGDFVNTLESINNFYHFRSPSASFALLFLLGTVFLICAIGDSKFAMKVIWLIIGMTFFVCWPISSLYPRYRLLVSPLKWLFWDIPTHAEWSFQYLHERCAVAREAILSKPSDNNYVRTGAEPSNDSDSESFYSSHSVPIDEEIDIMSFSCVYLHVPGRFIISTTAIRFVSSTPLSYESFHKPYSSLVEISKRQSRSSILSPLAKITTGMDKLELWFNDAGASAGMHGMGDMGNATPVLLENMRDRDKAFNSVIGFSGLRWQHLQKERQTLDIKQRGGSKPP
ncbi:hypothetical protein LCER1_G007475 [Lachnellula cervina]|uniref:GRAM domain-containing protein n=1 Tax=Lachnellula cervina TaxID=1316786 RepID=A0A7D8YUS1_9HELO|nr:hypothetical protein LCER1_G007475 [Lachnellula cervina]